LTSYYFNEKKRSVHETYKTRRIPWQLKRKHKKTKISVIQLAEAQLLIKKLGNKRFFLPVLCIGRFFCLFFVSSFFLIRYNP